MSKGRRNEPQQIATIEPGASTPALSIPKLRALARLCAGASASAAARDAKVDRATLWRWMRDDAAFIAELNRCRQELNDATAAGLRLLGARAVRVLEGLLSHRSAHVRLRACEAVLRAAAADARREAPTDVEDVMIRLSLRDRNRFLLGAMARHGRPAAEDPGDVELPPGPDAGGGEGHVGGGFDDGE